MSQPSIETERRESTSSIQFASLFREMLASSNVSVEAIAQATRISPVFIDAMRQGQLDELPGDVFVRGFVRNICRALKTDPEPLLQALTEATGQRHAVDPAGVGETHWRRFLKGTIQRQPRKETQDPRAAARSRRQAGARIPGRHAIAWLQSLWSRSSQIRSGYILLAVAGGALFVGVGIVMSSLPENKRKPAAALTLDVPAPNPPGRHVLNEAEPVTLTPTTAKKATTQTETGTVKEAGKEVREIVGSGETSSEALISASPTSDSPASPKADTAQVPAALGEDMMLEVEVTSPVKIRISKDGGANQTRELNPDIYEFRFRDQADLLIFDAAATKVAFNGRALGHLGKKGRVRRLRFSSASP